MAKFMDVHRDMKGISQKELKEAHDLDLKLAKESGAKFLQAWADPESGKVFCLSEAPNKESVAETHRMAGHPTDEIYEVKVEV